MNILCNPKLNDAQHIDIILYFSDNTYLIALCVHVVGRSISTPLTCIVCILVVHVLIMIEYNP